MDIAEATTEYGKALKAGRKLYKSCLLQGRYPYPPVLDEILDEHSVRGQVSLGVIEIPLDRVVGTKSAGRKNAFAANFMPLMEPDTEFAAKWIRLYAALSEEGIRSPIQCLEYLGRFYVQEGNKRVSVLRSLGAPTVSAHVVRVIPAWSEEPEILAYYEFLHAYQLTRLYQVSFSRSGRFSKLQTALGYAQNHVWTEEERRAFIAGFTVFGRIFAKRSKGDLPLTVADALLVWLKVYPFADLKTRTDAQLLKALDAIWPDIELLAKPDPIAVSTEVPDHSGEDKLLGRLLKTVFPARLNVAFISNLTPQESDWSRAHELGRQYLETVMGDALTIQCFSGVSPEEEADRAMDTAIANGAQVVFASTPTLIGACRRAAARHPGVHILNCSTSMPYAGVRTYYSRIYEGKFIIGAIAGALSKTGKIGYVASSPIFGVPAGINAFALGAQMTNPEAQILLRWSSVEEDAMARLAQDGAELIANRDLPTPDRMREPWGLCRVLPGGGFSGVAAPYWHWGNFYVKLVRHIMSGGWDAHSAGDPRAVNYWWGMRSGVVDVLLGDNLPDGVRQLSEILRQGISRETILPFHRRIVSQDGVLQSDGGRFFSPEEILHMDWLCEDVVGRIPEYDELLPMARSITRLLGIYRDRLSPDMGDPIL